jgi:hypothetical protein
MVLIFMCSLIFWYSFFRAPGHSGVNTNLRPYLLELILSCSLFFPVLIFFFFLPPCHSGVKYSSSSVNSGLYISNKKLLAVIHENALHFQ